MSNRAQRRAAGRRRTICVFCEGIELLDWIDGKIVPTLTDDDRQRMSEMVLQARQAFAAMEALDRGSGRDAR